MHQIVYLRLALISIVHPVPEFYSGFTNCWFSLERELKFHNFTTYVCLFLLLKNNLVFQHLDISLAAPWSRTSFQTIGNLLDDNGWRQTASLFPPGTFSAPVHRQLCLDLVKLKRKFPFQVNVLSNPLKEHFSTEIASHPKLFWPTENKSESFLLCNRQRMYDFTLLLVHSKYKARFPVHRLEKILPSLENAPLIWKSPYRQPSLKRMGILAGGLLMHV